MDNHNLDADYNGTLDNIRDDARMVIYYEIEEFDDGTYQIASGKEAEECFLRETKLGAKRKRFVEAEP